MVTKKPSHLSHTGQASAAVHAKKHVTLKAHHAKAYRKRHVGLLMFSLVVLAFLAIFLVGYRDQLIVGLSSSKSFVGDLFGQNKNYAINVKSSYGFNLSFDQKLFYGSAISNDTGNLYIGSELAAQRAYSVVRIAPNFSAGTQTSSPSSALTLTRHPSTAVVKDLDVIALQDGGIDASKLTRLASITTNLGGNTFQKSTWQSKPSDNLTPTLSARFVTYSGLVRGEVFTVVISLGIGGASESIYAPVLSTLSFDNKITFVPTPNDTILAKIKSSRDIIDLVTNTANAAAASQKVDLTGSEKIAALYTPAVVKVYHAYKMDVSVDGSPYLKGAFEAGSGSGFFVSQDGYLGTNGHVAFVSPQGVAISDALSLMSSKGDASRLKALFSLSSKKITDLPANATQTEAIAFIVDALYSVEPSRFTATNSVDNLLVQVTAKNPDITALIQNTKDGQQYNTSDSSVLKAKLVAADYRMDDNYGQIGFKQSDVAIVKVEGTNFPVVTLGSIDAAVQGSDLSIIGYPGNASSNGIVDASSSEATLTTGKVSSIKNALGSDKKLIETTATVGHGNSGGPVLAENGEVVGIATYTSDGSVEGTATYNYIRNIKDFTDLASAKSITFDTKSATQAAWQEGISNFYSAHYSKALKNFSTVNSLYPNDSRVAEFTAAAQKAIDQGKDVVDFPLVPVIIVSVVVLLGIGLGVFLIVRHHKKHVIYIAGVAQGTVQPAGPGVPMQTVAVIQPGLTVGLPTIPTILAAPTAPDVMPVPIVVPIVPTAVPVSYSEPSANVATPPVAPASSNPWFKSGTPPDNQPKL